MHGKTKPKALTKFAEMLYLSQPTPIVRIGEHDLNCVGFNRLRQIGEGGYATLLASGVLIPASSSRRRTCDMPSRVAVGSSR